MSYTWGFIKIFLALLLVGLVLGKGMTMNDFKLKLLEFNKSPLVSLLLVYDSVADNTPQLLALIKQISEKRKGFFNVVLMDCNTNDKEVLESFIYCEDQYRKALPALLFSQPTLNHELNSDANTLDGVKPYEGALNDKSLFNFAVPLMPTYSVELKNSRDLKKFQEAYPGTPNLIYFTDKQKDRIPPLYRALTANFRNTIAFAHVHSSSQIAKDYNITSFPVFLLNGKEKIQVKSNIIEMIDRLKIIEGEPINIFIKDSSIKSIELTEKNLEELVYKAPEHIVIHVVGENGVDHPAWANATKKFNKMFKCYQTFTLQWALGVKSTPAIVYFPKSIAKKSVQKTIFSSRETLQNIQKQIDSIIEDFTVPLSNFMELQKLTGIHLQDQKYVAIYFHSSEIPMSYKVVSNQARYQEEVAFFRMKDPDQQILEKYQIQKIPSLIVMIADKGQEKPALTEKEKRDGKVAFQLKLATFQGRFIYTELANFFNSFAQKTLADDKPTQNYEQESSNNIAQIQKPSKLKKLCSQNCYILLLNGNPENQEKNKNAINILQKQSSKVIGGNFGYIDGLCHNEFISIFDIQEDELPALIHIDAKFEKYSRMVGRVEAKSIVNFFAKVKARKAMYRGYDKIVFENKDCQIQLDKLKKLGEKTQIISDDEAAILAELKEEEEKKRLEFEKAKKQEKIRKKPKKRRPQQKDEENEDL